MGLGFQIMDDVMNLTNGNPGKGRGDDIVEADLPNPEITPVLQPIDFLNIILENTRAQHGNAPHQQHCHNHQKLLHLALLSGYGCNLC
jgi:octaprenyl-diphosphate synthase